MFSGEASPLVEDGRLGGDLAAAIDSDTCHEIVSVGSLRVGHPSSDGTKRVLVVEAGGEPVREVAAGAEYSTVLPEREPRIRHRLDVKGPDRLR